MSSALFLELFGDVFEHTPWVAEHTYRGGFVAAQDTAEGLHAALVEVMRGATREQKNDGKTMLIATLLL